MKKVFVLALSLFALCGVAFAQDVTFEDGGSLSGNYSGNVIINGGIVGVDAAVNIAGDVIINGGTFTIDGGAELTIEGTIYVYGGSIVPYAAAVLGDVVLDGGMLAGFQNITINNLTIKQSALTPQLGGSLTINESINVEGSVTIIALGSSMTLGENCEINVDPNANITGWTRTEFSLQPGSVSLT